MNKELVMVFVPGLSWVLFALGGTQISDTIKGWKGWRRFILPTVYMVACIFFGIEWWRILLVGFAAGLVYTLPYGVKTKNWVRYLVALGYGCISVPIGISIWNVLTVIGFITLYHLSNFKPTSKAFVWKICEGFFGVLVGIQLAYILMK